MLWWRGSGQTVAFSAVASSPPTRLAPQLFRVLLLRRLALPPSLLAWRPLCSVSESRSVGQSGIFCGERRCHKSNLSGTWTCLSLLTMLVGWRLSQMACLFGGPSWNSTQLLCPRCVQMGNPEVRQGRARLVVLAAEVGGRWSEEARSFVSQLASAKESKSAPCPERAVVECCPVLRHLRTTCWIGVR